MKVTRITRLDGYLFAHVCPICGNILASSSEIDMMPEFSICDCDKDNPPYDIFVKNGVRIVRSNIRPRFIGVVRSDGIESVEWTDQCGALEAAKAIRKALDYIADNGLL